MQRELNELRKRIRDGWGIPDGEFDRWLPEHVRPQSTTHWTPVGVAMDVARTLSGLGVTRVLDVGAGAGKFCVVGGLASEMTFVGVEQRGVLVEAARELAARFELQDRVHFVPGDLSSLQALPFDAVYFYNPFEEALLHAKLWIDRSVELGRAFHRRSVRRAEVLLERMPPYSYLVSFNGVGARIPGDYALVEERLVGSNMLRLFQKKRVVAPDGFWVELDDRTLYFRTRAASSADGVSPATGTKPAPAASPLRLVPRPSNLAAERGLFEFEKED